MSNIAVQGGAGGTGTVTLLAPSTSTDQTLTLPDATGTLVTTADIPYQRRARTFTVSGTYTPASDVKKFELFMRGSTGGKPAGTTTTGRGGNGGAGYAEKTFNAPLSSSYAFVIGTGGLGATSTAGVTSTFSTVSITGSGGVSSTAGSAGGVATGGDFNAAGGAGGAGSANNKGGGGGGGGAGSAAGNGGAGGSAAGTTNWGGGGGGGQGGNAGAAPISTTGGTGGAAPTTTAPGAYSDGGFTEPRTFQAGSNGGAYVSIVTAAGDGGNGASCQTFADIATTLAINGGFGRGGYGGEADPAANTAVDGVSGLIVIWEYFL